MPYNRELLASMALETVDSDEEVLDSSAPKGGKPNTRDDGTNVDEAMEKIIRCLKYALARSIESISKPEKQRDLDFRRDFTIETKTNYVAARSTSRGCDEGFCGFSSAQVKMKQRRNYPMGRNDSFPAEDGGAPYGVRQDGQQRQAGGGAPMTDENAQALSASAAIGGSFVLRNDAGGNYSFNQYGLVVESDEDEEEVVALDEELQESFRFVDYAPMCYQHIREFLDIDPKQFSNVLSNSKWHSIITPGKSEAQLFFCGRDWVIKTMTRKESEFLREILHRYYYHVRDNPYTLLPHFVGHHRLEVGTKIYRVVIMQNVFATTNTIHEKYDLKGSTIGRFASKKEKLQATVTQKDLDIRNPVHVGPERRKLLIDQIKKDCDFLKGSMIMDYSLLIGIHVLPSATEDGEALDGELSMKPTLMGCPTIDRGGFERDASFEVNIGRSAVRQRGLFEARGAAQRSQLKVDGRCFTEFEGGMLSNDAPGLRQEIYYMGIIDILQEYNTRKQFEHTFKGLLSDPDRISCVAPAEYSSRFIAFMSSIVV